METECIIQRIRDLIEYFRYTEYQFAKYVSIDRSNLSKILSGQRTAGEGVINKIVLATKCDKKWLVSGEGFIFPIYKIEKNDTRTIKGRIIRFMRENKIFENKFCTETQFNPDQLDDIMSGKTNADVVFIQKLKEYSPMLDLNWLITGYEESSEVTFVDNNFLLDRIEKLAARNNELEKELEQLKNAPKRNVNSKPYAEGDTKLMLVAEKTK